MQAHQESEHERESEREPDNLISDDPRFSEESLRALEWDRLLRYSQLLARSEPGKLKLGTLRIPQTWAATVEASVLMQQETAEVSSLLDREALWSPINELADPADILDGLGRGIVLGLDHLVILRAWLYAIDSWAQFPRDQLGNRIIRKSLAALLDPREPLRHLERVLTPEGQISEKASSKLAKLFAEIRELKRNIGITLDLVVKRLDQQGALQESFSDFRDGHYVVPVKVSEQAKVDGIIYGNSASRQSVFIEPREVEALNQKLRQKETELSHEIYEVLAQTSQQLQPFSSELDSSVSILSHWDAVQAKARLAQKYGGKPLVVARERVFLLSHTAHPLLWWSLKESQIIRNEINFGESGRVLLLTGPNTGGKTVLLKTLGLAAICARTGFSFPGADRMVVPFFDSVFVDLGDPQSIERQLSSFSGHVEVLKRTLENVTPQSLILFDELNSATDPQEGGALARAFLETVLSTGGDPSQAPLVVATTHDPQLKTLGFSDPRFVNASMEFDESAHTPSYRLALGIPGRSRALETAERLGIAKPVLDLARKYLASDYVRVDSLIERLERETNEASSARREAMAAREEAEKLKSEWTERTRKSVQDVMEKTRGKLRQIVDQAQDEIRRAVRKLEESRTHRQLDQARQEMNETFSRASKRAESSITEEAPELKALLSLPDAPIPAEPAVLEVGAVVRVPKWKSLATIIEVRGNQVKVQMNQLFGGGKSGLSVMLSLEDVQLIQGSELESHRNQQKIAQRGSKGARVQHEGPAVGSAPESIDLRGIRFEEAMSRLESYLDRAFRAGRPMVTIIHGLGTGAIREGARGLLSSLPYVKEFRDGGAGGGGAGATLVEFEKS